MLSREIKRQFIEAIQSGDVDTTKTLLDTYPDLINDRDLNGATAMIHVVSGRDKSHGKFDAIIRFLHERGANVQDQNNQGHTPLHVSVIKKLIDAQKTLVQLGALMNEPVGCFGRQALHWAVFNNDLNSVKHLVENGADLETIENYGHTPLSLARFHGYGEIADYLGSIHAVLPNVSYLPYQEAFEIIYEEGSEMSNVQKCYNLKASR